MSHAYVLIQLDLKADQVIIESVGIYSDRYITMNMDVLLVELLHTEAFNFVEAHERAIEMLSAYRYTNLWPELLSKMDSDLKELVLNEVRYTK